MLIPIVINAGLNSLSINNRATTILIAKVAITAIFLYSGNFVKGIVLLISANLILYLITKSHMYSSLFYL